jgi:hypothetical protein
MTANMTGGGGLYVNVEKEIQKLFYLKKLIRIS